MGQVTPLLWSWFGQYVTLRVPLATHASLDANTDCDDHDDKRILYYDRLTISDSLLRFTIILGQISSLLEEKNVPKSYTYTYAYVRDIMYNKADFRYFGYTQQEPCQNTLLRSAIKQIGSSHC